MIKLFSNAMLRLISVLTSAVLLPLGVSAHEFEITAKLKPVRADSHAPIGVMGDHRHKTGEWMISYRFMNMEMDGNLRGNNSISPDDIVTSISNPFPGPAMVRVVPTKMSTNMHMVGLMYALSDQVTLMAMVNYQDKEMDHITYAGMMGTQRLGKFTTSSSGIGDTKLSALWELYSTSNHKVHLNIGLSVPTGSIDETDSVFSPTGMKMKLRMPYAMQLGSGTYDLEPGITYAGTFEPWGWGAQYLASLRLGENDENYTLGDIHQVSVWGNYAIRDWISTSARIAYKYEGDIEGQDGQIMAPVVIPPFS